MHRAGEKTLSEAVRSEKATWGIDDALLRTLQRRGVKYVGVQVRDTKTRWLTHIDRFFDKNLASVKSARRGRVLERHLPLSAFRFRANIGKI